MVYMCITYEPYHNKRHSVHGISNTLGIRLTAVWAPYPLPIYTNCPKATMNKSDLAHDLHVSS